MPPVHGVVARFDEETDRREPEAQPTAPIPARIELAPAPHRDLRAVHATESVERVAERAAAEIVELHQPPVGATAEQEVGRDPADVVALVEHEVERARGDARTTAVGAERPSRRTVHQPRCVIRVGLNPDAAMRAHRQRNVAPDVPAGLESIAVLSGRDRTSDIDPRMKRALPERPVIHVFLRARAIRQKDGGEQHAGPTPQRPHERPPADSSWPARGEPARDPAETDIVRGRDCPGCLQFPGEREAAPDGQAAAGGRWRPPADSPGATRQLSRRPVSSRTWRTLPGTARRAQPWTSPAS